MRVSIVTISFNQAAFLERTIRSVIEQDADDIEYIVVDPGSTDGSRDIIERYRHRIAHVVLDKDDGPVDGLRRGFARATGEVCGYINADDAYLPGTVRQATEALARLDADLVFGHGFYVDQDDRVLRRFRSTPFSLFGCVHGQTNVMQQATFFRRDGYAEIGGFNLDNRTCWDLELCVDFALRGKKLRRINEDWGLFRIHGDSISGSGRLDALWRQDMRNIARKISGRDSTRWDKAARAALRLGKWACDPVGLYYRVGEALSGRRIFDRKAPTL